MMSCHILQILCAQVLPNTGAHQKKVAKDPNGPNDTIADDEDGLYWWLVDKDLLCLAAEVHIQIFVTLLGKIPISWPLKTKDQLEF